MKWKITLQFLLLLMVTIVISLFVFFAINVLLLYRESATPQDFYSPHMSTSSYTIDFGKNIKVDDGEVVVDSEKLKDLKTNGLWIQVLDENGTELYSRYKPKEAPEHYTPGKLIFYHQYNGAINDYTIFVGMLEKGGRNLSYIIGFPVAKVAKYSLYFRPETVVEDVFKLFTVAVVVITLISLLIGYVFSNRLAKPILNVVEGIQRLVKGDYERKITPKGLYKPVLKNLNLLTDTLKKNEVERKRVEEMREEWVTNITHDLKTPLASIKGYSEIMMDPEYTLTESEKEKYAGIISSKADYIGQLVEDLNLTYRLKNPSFPLKTKKENIVEVLRDCVIEILNHPLYEEVPMEFQAEVENLLFPCDKVLIKRAFTNLIYNAIVHNPPGTDIVVIIHQDSGKIVIRIKDYGKGIQQEELEKLFIRYYRGTNTGEVHKGSGLGLAIAKQIIEAHHGEITVKSEVGVGTEFQIKL